MWYNSMIGNCIAPRLPVGRMMQRLVVEATRETVFLITILPGDEAGAFAGIVSVPLRGYLAPGIALQVDAPRAIPAPLRDL